jgi:hypothetical protein
MKRRALISECGQYRYRLSRRWNKSLPSCLFIMLNPSTADAELDDPTIRRCIAFAKSWGYGKLYVGDLFAVRTKSPSKMKDHSHPVGPNNCQHLQRMALKVARSGGICVAAWGGHGTHMGQDKIVMKWFESFGVQLHFIKLTIKKAPCHPLYLRGDLKPTPWNP